MTKKDYVLLATAIAQAYAEASGPQEKRGIDKVLEHVEHALQIDNSRFSPSRFRSFIAKQLAA